MFSLTLPKYQLDFVAKWGPFALPNYMQGARHGYFDLLFLIHNNVMAVVQASLGLYHLVTKTFHFVSPRVVSGCIN